ncbi:MAG TPA: hypothetical protein VKV05_00460 [Terriglobales bacterium]|nr:hypothetical protein [Terriglobales bacterium]
MERVDGKTLFKRALRRRCPVCGRGAMFHSHFKINKACSVCKVTFWRDPGEVLGAMYFDWAAAMVTFLALWAALAWLTNLSELTQFFILSAAAAAAVLVCYPWSRSLWTVLVYLSGGIERPPLRVLPGGGGHKESVAAPVLPASGGRKTTPLRRIHRR